LGPTGGFFYSYDWDALLCRGDVSNANVCFINFSCVLSEGISLYVPTSKLRTSTKNNKHYDRNIQKLICKKWKYWKNFKKRTPQGAKLIIKELQKN